MAKAKYLDHVSKYTDSGPFKIIVDSSIYQDSSFLSNSLSKEEILHHIKDEAEQLLYIEMFTNRSSLIGAYGINDTTTSSCGESFSHLNYSINNYGNDFLGFISFDVKGIYSKKDIVLNNNVYFNVPSLSFESSLSFLNNVSDFYDIILSKFNIDNSKPVAFDYFDNYNVSEFFFSYRNNHDEISKVLTNNQQMRYQYHPVIGKIFAKINGFVEDVRLSNKCTRSSSSKRVIYKKGNKYISLDFQHFEFEKHSPNGRHLGSVRMFKGDAPAQTRKLNLTKNTHHLNF